ncbi:MAG: DNA-methyltransferase [Actinomycetota bacterium]
MTARQPKLDLVYFGDAIQLMKSWPAGFCSTLICDGPYGNRGASYGRARRTIKNDEHPLVTLEGVAAAYRLMKPNAIGFVFTSAAHLGFVQNCIQQYTDWRIKEVLVWSKESPGFGYTFRRAYELIIVVEKGTPTYRNVPISTVLKFARASTKEHPHAKPIPLLETLIRISTEPGDIVLDPFSGSASVGIAAFNLGRRYLGIELDLDHFEGANRKLESYFKAA